MALGAFSSLELWRLGPLSLGLVALFIVYFLHTWHVEAIFSFFAVMALMSV